jgi:hypothetical protein
MVNNYEAPEIVDIGEAQAVILGVPKQTDRYDSATQVNNLDPILSDTDE